MKRKEDSILDILKQTNTSLSHTVIYSSYASTFSSEANIMDFDFLLDKLMTDGLIKCVTRGNYNLTEKGLRIIDGGGYQAYLNRILEKEKKEDEKLAAELSFIEVSNEMIPFQKKTTKVNLWLVIISTLFVAYSIYQGEKKDTEIENLETKITKLEKEIITFTDLLKK